MSLIHDFEKGFSKYFNAFIMFGVPFFAISILCFMRRPKLYFAEHLVLSSYLTAQQSIFGILLMPLTYLLGRGAMVFSSVVSMVYVFYVLMQFFDYKSLPGFFRALGANALGMLLYIIAFSLILSAILIVRLKLNPPT